MIPGWTLVLGIPRDEYKHLRKTDNKTFLFVYSYISITNDILYILKTESNFSTVINYTVMLSHKLIYIHTNIALYGNLIKQPLVSFCFHDNQFCSVS